MFQVNMGEPAYVVSRSRVVLVFVAFAVILVSVSLMVAYIPDHSCPDASSTEADVTTTNPDDGSSIEATDLPPQGDGPWMDPFLNPLVRPVHYELFLDPDFYFDGDTFYGRENITIDVGVATQHVIVHYKLLNVTTLRVATADGTELQIVETFAYDPHEYWVTSLQDEVQAGTVIILTLEFRGSLTNGIVGYYKSTYVNQDTGVERSVAVSNQRVPDQSRVVTCFLHVFPQLDVNHQVPTDRCKEGVS